MADRELNIIIKTIDAFKRGFTEAGAGLRRLGSLSRRAMQGVRTVTRRATQAIKRFGLAAGAALVAVVKNATDFRTQMAEISTLTKSADVSGFTKEIIDLAAELGKTTEELTQGLYATLSAGIPEENAIDFLRTAAKSAIGGVADLKSSVNTLTTILDAYNMKASQSAEVTDLMFSAVKNGKVEFSQLATGMGSVVGVAAQAGIEFEELMGIVAAGSKTIRAERLFVALRSAILAVTAPGDALKKVFEDLGTTGEKLAREKGLQAVFETAVGAAGGSTAKLKELIPTLEALPVIMALTGENAAKTQAQIAKMASSSGAAAEAFKRMDAVRGWPRLWQSILAPIKTIGVDLDKWAQQHIPKITGAIAAWRGSPAFQSFLEKLEPRLEAVKKVVEDLTAGGSRADAALAKIGKVGEDIGQSAFNVLMKFAPDVGAAIAKGIATAPFKFAAGAGRRAGGALAEQAVREGTATADDTVLAKRVAFHVMTGGNVLAFRAIKDAIDTVRLGPQNIRMEAQAEQLKKIADNTGAQVKETKDLKQ